MCVGLGGCGENAPQWMWCVLDVVKMHLSGCGEDAPQWMWCVLDVVKMLLSVCGACWMW